MNARGVQQPGGGELRAPLDQAAHLPMQALKLTGVVDAVGGGKLNDRLDHLVPCLQSPIGVLFEHQGHRLQLLFGTLQRRLMIHDCAHAPGSDDDHDRHGEDEPPD